MTNAFYLSRFVFTVCVLACALTGTLVQARAVAATSATAMIASKNPGVPLGQRQLKPMRPTGVDPSGSGIAYAIVDVGVPPGSTVSAPYAFNNSGWIIGNAVNTKKGAVDCELAVGTGKFVDLSPSNTDTFCLPSGLNNVSSSGGLNFVGLLSTEYQADIPFYGTYSSKTGAGALHVFAQSYFAGLTEVNATGEALGGGQYQPLGWTSGANSALALGAVIGLGTLYVVPAGTFNFDVMQPACVSGQGVHLCASSISDACGFAACELNDGGTILALDSSNGKLMTYAFGTPSSAKDLPIVPAETGSSFINNANQVASSTVISTGYQAIVYSIGTGKETLIPFLPAASPGESDYCVPMSLNNAGAVLGSCTDQNDNMSYWTWDPKNSLRLLASEIPTSSAYPQITPLAINDNGQILVELFTPTFAVHWGLLDPTSSTVPNAKQRK